MPDALIDVKELILKYSVEELNEAVEQYWRERAESENLQSKPFTLTEIRHLLVQLAHLIGGLQLYAGMTVLEFGSGSCWAGRILNQLGLRVISCDVSKTALDIGRKLRDRYPPIGSQPEHIFLQLDGKRFDLPDSSVDRILSLDALHHVPSQSAVIKEMARVLKAGGIAGFSEPGPNHSRHPASQFEMRNYTVIENDICLKQLFEDARKCGFTEMHIAVAPIHPTMVPLTELEAFFSSPGQFLEAVRDRVTNYPIFFLNKGDTEIGDSRFAVGLIADIEADNLKLLARNTDSVRVRLKIKNPSNKTWRPSGVQHGCVNIGAYLYSSESSQVNIAPKQYRFHLSSKEVLPGATVEVSADFGVQAPGDYHIEIDLVSEHVCWFQVNGSRTSIVYVEVK